jgi:hypothetical protein
VTFDGFSTAGNVGYARTMTEQDAFQKLALFAQRRDIRADDMARHTVGKKRPGCVINARPGLMIKPCQALQGCQNGHGQAKHADGDDRN